MRHFTGTCSNLYERILAYLWEQERYVPAHELDKLLTAHGYVGNSGEVRARELARNDPKCPARYHGKVERRRGAEIGLDRRFVYFHYKSKPTAAEYAARAAEMCRRFDAGLPAEQIFAV
jgi:hypothetical protein